MTVYNQFRSEVGLLVALADLLAARGGMARMPEVFLERRPAEAIRKFVAVFVGFWASDRVLLRRLRALGVLRPGLYRSLRERDSWRREGAKTLIHRIRSATRLQMDEDATVDLLTSLTSFETFDSISADDKSPDEVALFLTSAILLFFGLRGDRRSSNPVRQLPKAVAPSHSPRAGPRRQAGP